MTDKASIHQFFDAFVGKRILVIGDVMIDAYLVGKVDRISPEAPVPVVALSNRENRLGGAANVALNIRNLGGIPILCSIIGDDQKGQAFLDLMERQSLIAEGIVSSRERITTVKYRIIGNNAQMLRVDEENQNPLSYSENASLSRSITLLIEQHNIDAIVFEDYDKGVITPELIVSTVALARKNDIPVVVDPKRRNFWAYQGVSLFKPNLKELKEGLKLDAELTDSHALRDAVYNLQKRMSSQIVMVTLSERGLFYSQTNDSATPSEGLIPAYLRSIADVSGAGDTVIGTAALCMSVKAPVAFMAALCNLAGGLVCEHVGVVPVDKEQLLKEAIKHFCQ